MSFFSSAVKSLTASSLTSQYNLSQHPTSVSGPWKIFDAKKKSTGQACSVFVFERKSLDPGSGGSSLRSNAGLKAVQDEVVERLKREVSLLARLRHPAILELVEPVEETRSGLVFVTEVVMGSLQNVLDDKGGGGGGSGGGGYDSGDERSGRRRRREVEIDELEIQKGLLQIAKGLEFLHESAGIVHGNLTPDAVFVNAKSDWKISAFSFATAHSAAANPGPGSNIQTDLVHLASTHDPRLPSAVQLSLDYAAPDLMLDSEITPSIDLFSLGCLIVSLYNSPHSSPLKSNNSPTSYRRLWQSSSYLPTSSNNFQCTKPLPKDLVDEVLPRLITRRPATRLNAKEFQEAGYFDNILVSTIRFLDTFPAKSVNEKNAFMRGLPRVLPQFPKNVAQKKILPMLVEELKDKSELLPFTLIAIMTLMETLPTGSRLIGEKVLPGFRLTFDQAFLKKEENKTAAAPRPGVERDGRDAGLAVLLERLVILREKCTTVEFKDDIVPLHLHALDSTTSQLQDLALKTLPQILPKIGYATLKTDVFPVVCAVFTKTASLSIKISCLEAFRILCGGHPKNFDDLDGKRETRETDVALDKFTIQEKVVPLLKGIKTKEPAVMLAALEVYQEIGMQVDILTLAQDVLPSLWGMALGPLLNLEQFQSFMRTIHHLSNRIETEQTKKLQDLGGSGSNDTSTSNLSAIVQPVRNGFSTAMNGSAADGDDNFENLVFGKNKGGSSAKAAVGGDDMMDAWGGMSTTTPSPRASTHRQSQQNSGPAFSWSTPSPTMPGSGAGGFGATSAGTLRPAQGQGRSVTPDQTKSSFATLQPNRTGGGAGGMSALQPSRPGMTTTSSGTTLGGLGMGGLSLHSTPLQPSSQQQRPVSSTSSSGGGGIDWSSASKPKTMASMGMGMGMGMQQQQQQPLKQESHPTILYGQTRQQAAPVRSVGNEFAGFSIAPPPAASAAAPAPATPQYGSGLGGLNLSRPPAPLPSQGMGIGMGMGGMSSSSMGMGMGMGMQPQQQQGNLNKNNQKTGLDAFESLL